MNTLIFKQKHNNSILHSKKVNDLFTIFQAKSNRKTKRKLLFQKHRPPKFNESLPLHSFDASQWLGEVKAVEVKGIGQRSAWVLPQWLGLHIRVCALRGTLHRQMHTCHLQVKGL